MSLQKTITLGEDSTRQFKANVTNEQSLAAEMAAFANTNGGTIYIGVADDGSTPGLSQKDVARINQIISNAASQQVRSPIAVTTENVRLKNERIVIVLTVPKGIDKPYFDKNGVIWLKAGADKRRVNSKEELRRFFQLSAQFHGDELPTRAGIDRLDKLRFRDFLRDFHKKEYPGTNAKLTKLLQTLNLATDDAVLNLAGVLLFAEQPELIVPQFVLKAIRFSGNEIHVTKYVDTENFAGPLQKVFEDSLAFIMRNLHKIQAGRGVNAPGLPEIPESVFEELLVNALVHRDYLISAPIRLFIYDNRIEIISPGYLPNNLTVEKIRAGNTNIRNPILVSYVAKGLLPYHGLGSGIARALKAWPAIDFTNDEDGGLFTATIHRKPIDELDLAEVFPTLSGKTSGKTEIMSGKTSGIMEITSGKTSGIMETTSGKTSGIMEITSGIMEITSGKTVRMSGNAQKIIKEIGKNPKVTIPELANMTGITERSVERNLQKLQQNGVVCRIGPTKGGRWEIIK